MCGFVGFQSLQPLPSSLLEKMTASISHRGPDDEGYLGIDPSGKLHTWKRPGEKKIDLVLGMGFRRLSILDLSDAGAQPMTIERGNLWITFNGEIYNYVELRREIPGADLKSTSDTEVLLHLLSRFGNDALAKLNGIFAFAQLDVNSRKITLVRDQFGVKPLYYTTTGSAIFYGSEIRPLLNAIGSPRLNRALVSRYLMCNWIPDPDTMFDGVFRLPPGNRLEIEPDLTTKQIAYWDLDLRPQRERSSADWVAELDSVLDRALDRQLRSDVPLAFFLSGGVDSSLLAVKASSALKKAPTTYTIGFQWSHAKEDSLDLESARVLAKRFAFNHQEIILSPSIVNLFPKVIDALEEPVSDPAAICSYLICESAKRDFKVLFSGQGADEIFGGYALFPNALLTARAQRLPRWVLALLQQAVRHVPYSIGGQRMQTVHRLGKFLHAASSTWPEALFHLRSNMATQPLAQFLEPDVLQEQLGPYDRHREIHRKSASWDVLRQSLYLDTKTYLPALNLFYTDKTSMANSVEVRVPYLDMEIAALAEQLPNALKVDGGRTKILLKRLGDKYLPQEIIHRKKTGFGLPVRDWLLHDLQPMAQDLLSPARLSAQKLFRPESVQKLLREHREKTSDHSAKIYLLMTLQLWIDRFEVRV